MASFREKEAFVVLYNMTSSREVGLLAQWVHKIHENRNIDNAVVLVLGTWADDEAHVQTQLIEEQRQTILQKHKAQCYACKQPEATAETNC